MFADQAAALIHRTKLHEQAERRSSDLAALNDANNGLLGTLDIETLLNYILDGATRLASEKQGFVCLFDTENGALARGVFRGLDKPMIRLLTERPETRAAVDEATLRLIDVGDGQNFIAIGLRSPRGTKGLIMVSGIQALVQERGYVLKAFGQQCSSAIGAGELYALAETKESELSSIIQSVPNPIVLSDAAGKIRSINSGGGAAVRCDRDVRRRDPGPRFARQRSARGPDARRGRPTGRGSARTHDPHVQGPRHRRPRSRARRWAGSS